MASTLLNQHKKTWENKKILRLVYTQWYKMILKDLASTSQPSVELGAGTGNFKEFKPDVISTDIDPKPWLDMSFDAHSMPFKNAELGNIIMIDVLHHLSNPVVFLHEAYRTLKPGGRLVILEPFPTLFSLFVYRKFHPEPFIFDVDLFEKQNIEDKHPWDSNQAIAYLLFYKHQAEFIKFFGDKFKIITKKRLSILLYPASGGFENRQMIPNFMIPAFQIVEMLLKPLTKWLAFRCYLVIEKIN